MNKFVFTSILFLFFIEGCHFKNAIVQSGKKSIADNSIDSDVTVPLIHGSLMTIPSDCAIYYPTDDSSSGMVY